MVARVERYTDRHCGPEELLKVHNDSYRLAMESPAYVNQRPMLAQRLINQFDARAPAVGERPLRVGADASLRRERRLACWLPGKR